MSLYASATFFENVVFEWPMSLLVISMILIDMENIEKIRPPTDKTLPAVRNLPSSGARLKKAILMYV